MNILPYLSYSQFLKNHFGESIWKISVDAGFTCPNRDGTVGVDGCIYCTNESFCVAMAHQLPSVTAQIKEGMRCLRIKRPAKKFLAYFQAFSNTYAPVEQLRKIYEEALETEEVVGLAIGTRPDCIDKEKVGLLKELAERTYVQLELGLQSGSNKTLAEINRGHTVQDFLDAAALCEDCGVHLVGHMIVGFPGETEEDYYRTAEAIIRAGCDGIKIHNLHLVKGSVLEKEHRVNPVSILSLEEYVPLVVNIIERLPEEMVVHRLWGNAAKEILVAPEWCKYAGTVAQAIVSEFKERGTRQGSFVGEWHR